MENCTVKHYTNGEITVVWKPEQCMHSGNCLHALPQIIQRGIKAQRPIAPAVVWVCPLRVACCAVTQICL